MRNLKAILKKTMYIVIFTVLITCTCTVTTNASVIAKHNAYKAYAAFLSKEYITRGVTATDILTSNVSFTTYDIDKNGIPELLIYNSAYAHVTGAYEIYTYSQNKVKHLDIYEPYVIKPQVIYSCYTGCGEMEEYYYTYVKGKLKCVCFLEGTFYPSEYDHVLAKEKDSSGDYIYYTSIQVNGKKTTLKAYKNKVKALRKNKIKAFKYIKNTSANRTKYLLNKAKPTWSKWSTKKPKNVAKCDIQTGTQYRYKAKKTTTSTKSTLKGWTKTGSKYTYGNWGSWSSWGFNSVTASDTRDVGTTKLYRYYYFYCPVCGGREPFQGTSDCHQYSLSLSDGHVGWFTTPYSASNYRTYSYTGAKYYTESLGDGKRWNFTASNLYDTASGTLDGGNGAVVIKTGYRYRTRSKTKVNTFTKWCGWSSWSTKKVTKSATRKVEKRTVYRYMKS